MLTWGCSWVTGACVHKGIARGVLKFTRMSCVCTIGFGDFLLFASAFGKQSGDAGYEARFDTDADDSVGFSDFLAFAEVFGKQIQQTASKRLPSAHPYQPALPRRTR